jgi:hypothetical protein
MPDRRRIVVGSLLGLALLGIEKRATHHENVFKEGDEFELRIFVSGARRFKDFNNSEALLWHEKGLRYSSSFASREVTVQVPVTDALLSNATLYAYVYVTKAGKSPDSLRQNFDKTMTATAQELVEYSERLEPVGLHNLLTGEQAPWEVELNRGLAAAQKAGRPAGEYISYWKPKLHAQLLVDTEAYAIGEMPPLQMNYLQHHRLVSGHRYRPLIYINELTTMKGHWLAVNKSLSTLPLELSFGPLPSKRFQWMVSAASPLRADARAPPASHPPLPSPPPTLPLPSDAPSSCVPPTCPSLRLPLPRSRSLSLSVLGTQVNLEHSFKMNEELLGISEKESEEMRGMFVHTNPTLLYTTVAVSTFHLLFDCLAFKNDISFWNSVETMEGLSSRSLILNQVMEVIIFLYLLEQDSSWLIKVTSIFTLVLGVFKIFKSLRVRKRDAEKAKGAASLTDEIDRLAYRYISPPLLLLVIGYSGYSLYTGYYKSWYSWILESLVALVYGAGFVAMTPQLFINYRLKSVAHLNWKFFMYKALNTFIDDLFAFIIKMPTLHRMSCFRDDLIFVVFLYQRWVYRVDMKRVNEYGHRGEEGAGEDDAKQAGGGESASAAAEGSARGKKKVE